MRNLKKKDILDNYKISELDLNRNHIIIDDMYCGTDAELYRATNEINKEIVLKFKEGAKKFYIKFCDILRTKINFDDDMLKWFLKFSPENLISGETGSIVPFLVKTNSRTLNR